MSNYGNFAGSMVSRRGNGRISFLGYFQKSTKENCMRKRGFLPCMNSQRGLEESQELRLMR